MPITGRADHSCVRNPCLSLGFAALPPRRTDKKFPGAMELSGKVSKQADKV